MRIPIRPPPQHRIDDRLRLGPRVEGVRRKGELQTPKFAASENTTQRLVLQHADLGFPNTAGSPWIYQPIGMGKKVGMRERESRGEQSASLAAGLLKPSAG